MDKLKLIIACAVIVGLTQLELDGGPQRKYYTGSQAIKARQEAAAAGDLPAASADADQGVGICTGGICTRKPKSAEQLVAEQVAREKAQQAAKERADAEEKIAQLRVQAKETLDQLSNNALSQADRAALASTYRKQLEELFSRETFIAPQENIPALISQYQEQMKQSYELEK